MEENKIENVCEVCKKPVDLDKDDFVVGVFEKYNQFFHLACMKDYEKEKMKMGVIEEVEDEYDLSEKDADEDDDSDDDLDDDIDDYDD